MNAITRHYNGNQRNIFDFAGNAPILAEHINEMHPLIDSYDEEEVTSQELAAIRRGLDDIKRGRTYKMQEGETLTDFLDRIESCIKP